MPSGVSLLFAGVDKQDEAFRVAGSDGGVVEAEGLRDASVGPIALARVGEASKYGWDDTCCNINFVLKWAASSGLAGGQLIGLSRTH